LRGEKMRTLMVMFLSSFLSATVSAGTPFAQLTAQNRIEGRRPTTNRFDLGRLLNADRKTDMIVTLGGIPYHLGLATNRRDQEVITLLPVGAPRASLSGAATLEQIAASGWEFVRGGSKTTFTVEGGMLHLTEGDSLTRIGLRALRAAVWRASAPVPSLGADWRLAYQSSLFAGAGLRSFVFQKMGSENLETFVVTTTGIGTDRTVLRTVDGIRVGLRIDSKSLVLKTD